MNYQYIIIALSISYVSYYVVAKNALQYYSQKQILANIYLIVSVFVLILYNRDLVTTLHLWKFKTPI